MDKDDKGTASGIAVLNGEVEIMTSQPLPHLDKGPVKAFAARHRDGGNNLFAMICEPHLVPRSGEIPSYSSVKNSTLCKLVSSGPAFWPPAGAARYCFVYENKLGKPLASTREERAGLGWRPDHVLKTVIRPLVNAIADLHGAGIVHGNIRPDNIFTGDGATFESAMLGECLSTPPSYSQPVLFETVERAMFDKIGKGKGIFADDVYALGVSLAVLLRRKDPMEGKSDEEIIREKISQGSYIALFGKERITGPLLEFLRGLLYDDRDQRWTVKEMLTWLEGQHLSSKQSTKRKRTAARPLMFDGKPYERPFLLARDLYNNLPETVQLIESGSLEQWVTRSLEDSALKERLDSAIESAREFGRGTGYPERLASRLSVALDPEGPMRYRGVNIHPGGFSYALAEAVALKKDLQPYAEMIKEHSIMYWLTEQTDPKVETGTLISRFDSCRSFVRNNSMGYGIEHCLYYLDPEIPCLSDRVRRYYVRSTEDMLYAFEALSKTQGRPALFIDRHIAAFLSVKERKVIDVFASDLGSMDEIRRIMGNLKVLASIQQRFKMEYFPGISSWLADIIEPLYGRFHDRELRAKLRKKMDKLEASGDLIQIALLFDDFETMENDFAGFRGAMEEYFQLRQEEAKIEGQLERPELLSSGPGRKAAAVVSALLSLVIIAGFGVLFFLRKGAL